MSRHMIDLSGKKFGRLHVLRTYRKDGETWVVCWCECGNRKEARAAALGRTIFSCGCLRRKMMHDRQTKHGEGNNGKETPEYRAWLGMKRRCAGHDEDHRRVYTDRGITVCRKWKNNYAAFLADVGRRPSPEHSLDRFPDNDGNYEPGNVRWATRSEQAKNRRPRLRDGAGCFAGGPR